MPETEAGNDERSELEQNRIDSHPRLRGLNWNAAAVLLFSGLYFPDTILRASEKRFWYDELCTLYICRLPSFGQSWTAVLHGADFNPPLFYLIQRAGMSLLGSGQIGMRVPEMVGFWLLSACLFAIVYRRVGVLGGWAAMTFLMTTNAYFYAYEARPHALVLGFCGLALLCWQYFEDCPRSWKWLVAFSLSLEAAFLTHCYAVLIIVPFAAVEFVRTLQARRIRWQVWAALAVPASAATAILMPLVRSFKANVPQFAPPSLVGMKGAILFYQHFLSNSDLILLAVLIVFGMQGAKTRLLQNCRSKADVSGRWELMLYLMFLGMPLFGLMAAYAAHGPFTPRYYLSGLIGIVVLLGRGVGLSRRTWGGWAIAALLGVLLLKDVTYLIRHRLAGWGEGLVEPSSGLVLSTMPGDPLSSNTLLKRVPVGVPIAVPEILDFLYLVHYWPGERAQLYSVSYSDKSDNFRLNRNIREWCHVPFNKEETASEFFSSHSDFLLYGRSLSFDLLSNLVKQGAEVRSLQFDKTNHFLAEVRLPYSGRKLQFAPAP